MDLLILGCGYVGERVAAHWLAQRKSVAALTRGRGDTLATRGITPIRGDVTDTLSLSGLPPARTVLHAVGFDRTAGYTQRQVYVTGLENVLERLPHCDRFLHISSTGVYGQTAGEWVDETSATEPFEESGKVVLDAEAVLKSRLPSAVILRFAGIYGPNRLLRKAALLAGEPLMGDAEKSLNLIHVDDGVQAITLAEKYAQPGAIYNITDDHPPTRRQFYTHLAELLGAPTAKFVPPMTARREPNRRVSNRKARADLGFNPRHASYAGGLVAALSDPGSSDAAGGSRRPPSSSA